MFDIRALEIQGFRGFSIKKEFEFDQPVALLFGENHRGKSSTLNAIEWCLFGEDCIGKKTGIRERVGWEVPNRFMKGNETTVAVEFSGPDGIYRVTRVYSRQSGRRTQEVATVKLPDEKELIGEDAEDQIFILFGSSFLDFMTTVYQHQEAIRAILTQEPRQRNDAIDRLLGLSQYRELLKGIGDARLDKTQKAIETRFEGFRMRAEQSIRTLDNLIREEKAKAVDEGIGEPDLTELEALKRVREVAQAVRSLADQLGIGDFHVDVAERFEDVAGFRESVKDQIDMLWAQAPDVTKQETLAREQQELTGTRGRLEAAKEVVAKAVGDKEAVIGQHGDEKTLVETAQQHYTKVLDLQDRIRKGSAKANLVGEAIRYLSEMASGTDTGRCPLCGADTPNLLAHLEYEWKRTIEEEVGQLETEKQTYQSEHDRFQSLKSQLQILEGNLVKARSALEKCISESAVALRREIGKDDDAVVLVNARLGLIASELESLGKAIEDKRNKISGIYSHLTKLRIIHEILEHQRKKATVERIWETEEFSQLDNLMNLASLLVEDAMAIRRSLAAMSRDEAEAKIAAAQVAIDKYFRDIANHPAIPGLALNVTEDTRSGLNAYEFHSTDGTDPTPILSQGDLNCLALSLFLGLAQAAGEDQSFDFLMLDDPTQSLGTEMKQRLVGVLEDIAGSTKLVISTPDTEVKDLVMNTITKSKAVYNFIDWTEAGGPIVTRGI